MVSLKMRGGKIFCSPLVFLVGCILPVYYVASFFFCNVAYPSKKKKPSSFMQFLIFF